MKHKISKFKRILAVTMAATCMVSTAAAISADAASATKTGTTTLGYRVSSTASYSGKTVTGIGRVVSGGPCSIKVDAMGYYISNGVSVLSCRITDKNDNTQNLTKSTSGNYTLTSAKCIATFNSATTITATV